MDTFDGRVSLVTGSSRGIGAAIANARIWVPPHGVDTY